MKNVIECNGLVITIVCEGDEDNQETKVTVERGDEVLEELIFTDEVNDEGESEEESEEGIKDFDSFDEDDVDDEGEEGEGDEAESIDAFDEEDDDDETNESSTTLLDFNKFITK